MLGEIGRLDDVVFIETTQVGAPNAGATYTDHAQLPGGTQVTTNPFNPDWRGTGARCSGWSGGSARWLQHGDRPVR